MEERSSEIFGVEMEIIFFKKVILKLKFGMRNIFPSPQTRRQVSAYG